MQHLPCGLWPAVWSVACSVARGLQHGLWPAIWTCILQCGPVACSVVCGLQCGLWSAMWACVLQCDLQCGLCLFRLDHKKNIFSKMGVAIWYFLGLDYYLTFYAVSFQHEDMLALLMSLNSWTEGSSVMQPMISSGTQGQRLGFTLIGTTSVPCHVLWHFCAVYSPLVDEAPTSHIPALCA